MSQWFQQFGFSRVGERLLAGAYPSDSGDVGTLTAAGVQEIVNLCQDAEYRDGARDQVAAALAEAGIPERRVELVDHGSLPAPAIERAVDQVLDALDSGRTVYLHCRAGWQRSAAVAAGAIALREGIGIEDALETLRERKPTAEPLAHQRADLLAWWAARDR